MDLQKGAGLKLDISRIPGELHHLVPYVEKWGFASLDDQDVFVEEMQREYPQEIQEFNARIDQAMPLIHKWGASLPELNKHINELTSEDWSHPYWSFLNALKLREITGYADDDDPGVKAARQRFAQEVRLGRFEQATVKADDAFRLRDYAAYVSILSPFEDLLSPVQKTKYELATRRMKE